MSSNISKIEPKYSTEAITDFANEDAFMEAYVELLKQSIEILYYVSETKYFSSDEPISITKDEAVVAGNLARLIKLNISLLQNTCESKLEICQIISRSLAETFVNLKYILVKGEANVKRNYIKHSLITEKSLWQTIKDNIDERDEELPIETRMKNSIQSSFDESDFELDEVSKSSKWKSIKARVKQVSSEAFYDVFYGISSHAVHGNWQDILGNHLNKVEEGFKMRLEWNRPRPQIIHGPIIFNLDIALAFSDNNDSEEFNLIKSKAEILKKYLLALSEGHEELLKKRL
jgi:hypothetical protein